MFLFLCDILLDKAACNWYPYPVCIQIYTIYKYTVYDTDGYTVRLV